MSIYSEYALGYIDKAEFDSYCAREDAKERAYMERMLYEDACYERCEQCELWDDEEGRCESGEDIFNCTLVG